MKIFVIYDLVAECNLRIMQFENADVCCRFLKNAFDVPNSPFVLNCSDTILIEVGQILPDLSIVPAGVDFSVNVKTSDLTGNKKIDLSGIRIKKYDDLISDYLRSNDNEKREKKNI